jgi:hypothetical protein
VVKESRTPSLGSTRSFGATLYQIGGGRLEASPACASLWLSESVCFFTPRPIARCACVYALANRGHDTRRLGWLGPRVDRVDGGLYGAGAESVQGFLAGVAAVDARDGRRTGFGVVAEAGSIETLSKICCSVVRNAMISRVICSWPVVMWAAS